MHNILAIETAGEACSVALSLNGEQTSRFELAPRQHSQRVFSLLRDLLADGDLRTAGIEAIAYGSGPGSFTGLRIAASVVQGLAFAHQLPALPVSTLALQVQTAARHKKLNANERVLSIMDARLGEVYACEIDRSSGLAKECCAPVVCTVESLPDMFPQLPDHCAIVGAGLQDLPQMAEVSAQQGWRLLDDTIANALDMLPLADAAMHNKEMVSATEVIPRYVRNEVSWKKLSEQGKRS